MTEMKSAYERAMERAEKLGKATPEELLRMEALPIGNRMAARFMKEPDYDLNADLMKYKGSGVRKQVIEGVLEVLLRYIVLPTGAVSRESIPRAKQGIMLVKEGKKTVEAIFAQLDTLFNYYEQARQHTFNQLKQAFEQKIGQQLRAVPGQRGPQLRMDVTTHPQFQEEWGRALSQLNVQYEQALAEQKQRLLKTP
ncbi:MAG: hypothetical protein AB1603_06605 [Chloroflexota bacterium]